jgi:hypothetical protein
VTAVDTWQPLYRTAPAWSATDGDLAVQLALDMGWTLDDVQQWHVDANLAVGADGLPACRETAIVGPRQTVGKTVGLQVCALFDVFIAEVPLHVWTAHLYSTSQKTYYDMRKRILRNRDYARRCDFRETNGEQSILVDNGCRLEFHARSGKGGRGFTTSRLTLDEWLFGRPGDLGALAPTIVTMRDAQIRYASSAGKLESGALRDVVARGRKGSGRLAYLELGAPREPCEPDGDTPPALLSDSRCRHPKPSAGGDESCALNRRHLWWHANSGLWSGRVREEDVEQQREMLDALEFAREFLSWHEDPLHEDGGAFDAQRFAALASDQPRRAPVWFGVAVAPDRSWSAVCVAWRRPGGGVHMARGPGRRVAPQVGRHGRRRLEGAGPDQGRARAGRARSGARRRGTVRRDYRRHPDAQRRPGDADRGRRRRVAAVGAAPQARVVGQTRCVSGAGCCARGACRVTIDGPAVAGVVRGRHG